MMKDLKDALKGGLGMANNKINVSEENAELINPNFVKEEDKQKEKEDGFPSSFFIFCIRRGKCRIRF